MSNKNIILEQWIQDTAITMAKENLRIFKGAKESKENIEVFKQLGIKFVEAYLHGLVYSILNSFPKNATDSEKYKYVSKNFSDIKDMLQIAVSEGFEKAIVDYSGRYIEYYCAIKPVPAPKNKLIN